MYILDLNSKLPSHTICVTYFYSIYLIIVCVNCPLTSKTGGCWNLLESSPDRIPFIELSQKWARILFIILNSKLGHIHLQPAYNRCKLTIQIVLCSNSRPYNTLSWNSYTLNSSQYTNYIPVTCYASCSAMFTTKGVSPISS